MLANPTTRILLRVLYLVALPLASGGVAGPTNTSLPLVNHPPLLPLDLGWLVAPSTAANFLSRQFSHTWFVPPKVSARSAAAARLTTLSRDGIEGAALRALQIAHGALRPPHVKAYRNGERVATGALGANASSVVRQRLAQGDSFVLRLEAMLRAQEESEAATPIQHELAPLRLLRSNLERQLLTRVTMHLYISAPSADVLAPHADPYDVIVLQLKGQKRWQICVPGVDADLGGTPLVSLGERAELYDLDHTAAAGAAAACASYSHGDMLRMSPCRSITLSAGNVLYIPKGFAHFAHTLPGAASTHLTIGIQRRERRWRDLVEDCVHERVAAAAADATEDSTADAAMLELNSAARNGALRGAWNAPVALHRLACNGSNASTWCVDFGRNNAAALSSMNARMSALLRDVPTVAAAITAGAGVIGADSRILRELLEEGIVQSIDALAPRGVHREFVNLTGRVAQRSQSRRRLLNSGGRRRRQLASGVCGSNEGKHDACPSGYQGLYTGSSCGCDKCDECSLYTGCNVFAGSCCNLLALPMSCCNGYTEGKKVGSGTGCDSCVCDECAGCNTFQTCPALTAPTAASVTYPNNRDYPNGEALYACLAGFIPLSGSNPNPKCSIPGVDGGTAANWDDISFSCLGVPCPNFPTLADGSSTTSSTPPRFPADTIAFTCNPGFYLTQGPPARTCSVSGNIGDPAAGWDSAIAPMCSPCPAGKYKVGSDSGHGGCTPCITGRFGSAIGATSFQLGCQGMCPIGTFQLTVNSTGNTDSSNCTDLCPGGKFGVHAGQTSAAGACEGCAKGKYSAATGLTSSNYCTECPPDHTTLALGNTQQCDCYFQLETCPKGKYATSGVEPPKSCSECSAGKWSNTNGLLNDGQCSLCARGRFSQATGLQADEQCAGRCAPGRHSNKYGAVNNSFCEKCAVDHVSLPGAVECRKCAYGKVPNKDKIACEGCIAGEFKRVDAAFATCNPCPKGSVALPSVNNCSDCKAGSVPDSLRATCLPCADGTYAVGCSTASPCTAVERGLSSINATGACRKCPLTGTTCRGGLLEFDANAWYDRALLPIRETTEVHNCFNSDCCTMNTAKSRVHCNAAKGYKGPLCGACDRAKGAMRSGRGCSFCWDPSMNWLATSGIVLLLASILAWYTFFTVFAIPVGEYMPTVQKMMFSHIQMLGVLGIFKARGTKTFNKVVGRPSEIVGGSISSMLPIKCAIGSQSYGPFLLNMMLPLLVPLVVIVYLVPMTMVERKRRAGRTADSIAPVFKGKFGIPRFLACCAFMRKPMSHADVKAWRSRRFDPIARFAGVMVFVLFALYPTLVASIASIMNCTVPIGGVRYLMADLTVQCYDGWHIAFLAIASLCSLLYCIGIPLGIGIVVALKTPCVCREKPQTEEGHELIHFVDEAEDADPSSEVRGSEEEAEEEVEAQEEEEEEAKEDEEEGHEEEQEEAEEEAEGGPQEKAQVKPACKPRFRCERRAHGAYNTASLRTRFGFLYAGYATDRSGIIVAWEVLVMLQKLAVTLAGSAVSDAYLQILVAILILVVSLTLQAYCQPYQAEFLNVLHTTAIFVLIVTQILSILYFYVESAPRPFMEKETLEIAVTAGLFTANAVSVLAFALTIVELNVGVVKQWRAKRWRLMRVVLAEGGKDAVVTRGEDEAPVMWRHPSLGIAVAVAPHGWQHAASHGHRSVWLWGWGHAANGKGGLCTAATPEMLESIASVAELVPGDRFCYMHPKTRALTGLEVRYVGVGGCCSSGASSRGHKRRHPMPDDADEGLKLELQEVAPRAAPEEGGEKRKFGRANPLLSKVGRIDAVGEAAKQDDDDDAVEEGAAREDDGEGGEDGWYYADDDDDDHLHGPYQLDELQEWYDDGHFQSTDLIRRGKEGESVPMLTVLSGGDGVAAQTAAAPHREEERYPQGSDGASFTLTEFLEHYGESEGKHEWGTAEKARYCADGSGPFRREEFVEHFGGGEEWDAAVVE